MAFFRVLSVYSRLGGPDEAMVAAAVSDGVDANVGCEDTELCSDAGVAIAIVLSAGIGDAAPGVDDDDDLVHLIANVLDEWRIIFT